MNYKMNLVIDETRRILLEQPHLKYYEAINQAKKILKKEPSDGNLKSSKVINNQFNYITKEDKNIHGN